MGGRDDFVFFAGNPDATAVAAAAAANAQSRGGIGTKDSDGQDRPSSYDQSASPMKVDIGGLSPSLDTTPKRTGVPKVMGKKKSRSGMQGDYNTPMWADDSQAYVQDFMMYPPGEWPPPYFYPDQMQMATMAPMIPPAAGMYSPMWDAWGGMHGMYGGMPMPGYPPAGYMPPPGAGGQGRAQDKTTSRSSRRRHQAKAKGAREPEPATAVVSEEDASANRSDALNEVYTQGDSECQLTLGEIIPHLTEFAQDRLGHKYLISKLEQATPEEKNKVFETLLLKVADLSSNMYSYMAVQKLFDIADHAQRKRLVEQLSTRLLKLANEPQGCRVIQHAIQNASRDSQILLAAGLKENVIMCIENMHGNHVIQKCIEQMPPESVGFIIDAIEGQTEKMATHAYGCRVIQRLLEHCASQQLQRILDQLLLIIPKLAKHRFGNYVVQHILEHGRQEDKKRILSVIQENIVEFAKGRCSSNVVEKCLEIATVGEHAQSLEHERAELMALVLGQAGDLNAPLNQMMDDKFGNYIVQRVAEHSRPGPERELLQQQIMLAEPRLAVAPKGKHILAALQKDSNGQAALPSQST